MEENKTSLLYWFPKVIDLGIPVPRTVIMPVDARMILGALEGETLTPEFLQEFRTTANKIGFPLFLRTDLQSGKHGWNGTCYVSDTNHLQSNLLGVAEENEMGACMFGPHYTALVFREFLELETSFIAFYGNMPINKERRYFICDGEILCHHAYWPSEAIEGHTEDANWKTKLAALNEESPEEIKFLSDYALRVMTVLPEFWSVDFAKARNGNWYLIDMALGKESYHWRGCPNESLEKQFSMLDSE